MSVLWLVLGLVALQRVAELSYARRNTAALLARGGIEAGAAQYPWFVALHAAWLASMALFVPASAVPNWWLLGLYALLQIARLWVVASLGPFWTARVITLPNAPLVRSGPYRLVRHPNYLVVALEIAVLPLAFGALVIALVFSVLDAVLIGWRIRVEDDALSARRDLPTAR
ncbi:MAG TPA: isoprenylcysteine carboxylmethyltransferase family protein [Candidatus Acidoferrales bacterium]|nr:isoprenylcysteine carboxylmethyltransferase family protein [Candidatus Acidoferrales bacterium]